jgi:mono/diheme cytochrome c family protein
MCRPIALLAGCTDLPKFDILGEIAMVKGLFLGFIATLVAIALFGYICLRFMPLPVAVADKPFPFEKQLVKVPLGARIHAEAPAKAPFDISEDVYESGAHIYREQCAACHGLPGIDSSFGPHMYPNAPQLWKKHKGREVVGVSDDPVGDTYWRVANGIRLTGMPSYDKVLSPIQMWQVTLLVANADKEMPEPVKAILQTPLK